MASSLIGAPGIENTSPSFRAKLVESAKVLGIDPDQLATVISFETGGTFSPTVRNPASRCVGLIQWCRDAAIQMAKTDNLSMTGEQALDWLATKSAEQQLDYVVRYYQGWLKGRTNLTMEQAYLIVFAPAFAFRPMSSVAYKGGTKEYEQNKGLDVDKDGNLSVGDIASKIQAHYRLGQSRPRVPVSDGKVPPSVMTAGITGSAFSPKYMAIGAGAALGYYVISQYVGKTRG